MFGVKFYGDKGSSLDTEHYPLTVIRKDTVSFWDSRLGGSGAWVADIKNPPKYDLVAIKPNFTTGLVGATSHGYDNNRNGPVIRAFGIPAGATVDVYYIEYKAIPKRSLSGYGIEIYDDKGVHIFTTESALTGITRVVERSNSQPIFLGAREAFIPSMPAPYFWADEWFGATQGMDFINLQTGARQYRVYQFVGYDGGGTWASAAGAMSSFLFVQIPQNLL